MSLAIGFPTSSYEKSEAKDHAIRTATFLAGMAALLESKRFERYVGLNTSRLSWAGKALHDKLRKDLFFQIRQGVNVRIDEDVSVGRFLTLTAADCDAEIKRLSESWGFELPKKARSFKVPRDGSVEDEVLKLFSTRPPAPTIKDMGRPFYLWNSIDAIQTFMKARRTLSQDTGHARFERFLAGLSEPYMLEGYPHDLLAHDAEALMRPTSTVVGLLVRREWCSTWTVDEKTAKKDGIPQHEGFDFVAMA